MSFEDMGQQFIKTNIFDINTDKTTKYFVRLAAMH